MNIKLISNDSELCRLCRDALAQLAGPSSSLVAVGAEEAVGEADLYIWDFQRSLLMPERLDQTRAKHLFIVHRTELASFDKKTLGHEGNILLKPVTRATLEAFLGL